MVHLIADTGIQFHTIETELSTGEQLTLGSGRPLRYSFCNITNEATGQRIFDLLTYNPQVGRYIPVNELVTKNGIELLADGRAKLDESGVEIMRREMAPTLFTQIETGSDEMYNFNTLLSYTTPNPANMHERIPAFELLLGHWLPMPMFELHHGITADVPYAWCRVKIDRLGAGSKANTERYRFTWAFDTRSSSDTFAVYRPTFPGTGDEKLEFALCNRVSDLIPFLSPNGDFTVFSHYIAQLLGLDPSGTGYRYIGFYIYLINYIRLCGASPEVTLYNCPGQNEIPVDLVLDIGNSRTCGLLFENGDFTRVAMLALRDLTNPGDKPYDKPFDMRLVFRQTDFGNDIVIEEEDMFRYASFVRVGEEARRLIYLSTQNDGLRTSTTNYSSPKRYLWDNSLFDKKWEFLVTDTDPLYIRTAENIYIPGLSDLFDAGGRYITDPFNMLEPTDGHTRYSRSSLMTFVMIEILQQALMQINSEDFRRRHGNINCKRRLRSLILTCPTAMPRTEQIKLRQCAKDAFDALSMIYNPEDLPHIDVYPSVESLSASSADSIDTEKPAWIFDEATSSQLVYLYAEIAERYKGNIRDFFEFKGHVRPELEEEGYHGKSLTVASVDIGAGTTDVMVCTYTHSEEKGNVLCPSPIFWDSYYVAGDDILRNIIRNIIIEDLGDDYADMGSIHSALRANLSRMNVEQIARIPVMDRHGYYRTLLGNMRQATDRQLVQMKEQLAVSLLRDFFGQDSTMMEERERRYRVDFNTQISHPMAQFFMEQLRLHRPRRVYTFNDIFTHNKPSGYLLDYFREHFGFSFEDLKWLFDPERVADIVKSTMEKLLKQISMMLYAHQCDIIVLSGRPTSLDAITELFVKYLPVMPENLVRLNEYRVGQWYPLADPQGYFYDQKAVVAVGAMVGHLASANGFNGMSIDFSEMSRRFRSTADFIACYEGNRLGAAIMSPTKNSHTLAIAKFPAFFGCKQFDTRHYEGRPVYALFNNSGRRQLNVTISRDFSDDPEALIIEDITDANGDQIPLEQIEFRPQSIIDDGEHWLDKGEFELSVTPR